MKTFLRWIEPVTDLVYDWIDTRTGLCRGLKEFSQVKIPGRPCICRSLPCAIAFTFIVQAITGLVMMMYYSTGAQTAWESIYFLQYEVQGGWLLRAMHHWSGQILFILVALYVISMIVRGAYRAPREFVFWMAVFMGLVALCLLLTGDLLGWDQNSLSCTQVRTNFLELLPFVGSYFLKLAVGGPGFGHLSLTRFLVLHGVVLAAAFCGLLILHAWFANRARKIELETATTCTPLWPAQTLCSSAACLIVMAIILLAAVANGPAGIELGAPADTTSSFDAARPEWAFMGLYGFAEIFPSQLKLLPIFIIPTLLVVIFLLMPFIGSVKAGHVFNVIFVLFLLAGNAWLSYRVLDHDKHNENHQIALREAEEISARVKELAKGKGGIPAGGALKLLQEDSKIQGPILFKQHCASCHDYTNAQGEGIKAEKASAPNLYAYATREWTAGWFDPEKIKSDAYFGGTKFRRGDMVQAIEAAFEDLDEEDTELTRQDMQTAAIALSAQAQLTSQKEIDAKDVKKIKDGDALIVDDLSCTDCHKYGDKGKLGTAADLTGYGSREWTIGIIKNPAHPRFYGKENDRMPAYAESGDEAANLLTNRDIELLADWLRGDWFEPAAEGETVQSEPVIPPAKPAPKAEAKAEVKPEAKPEPKAEVKPETKPAPKAEVKPEDKPAAQAEPQPEVKAEEPKPAAEPAKTPETPTPAEPAQESKTEPEKPAETKPVEPAEAAKPESEQQPAAEKEQKPAAAEVENK